MEQCIGVDLHRKYMEVCVMDAQGAQLSEGRLHLDSPDEIFEFFSQFPPHTDVVMEATMGWMWLSDVLEALGLDVHLAHMKGVKVIAESRCKTDKIDARTLAHLFRTNYLPEAYLAPGPVRDKRMVLRHRQGLIAWRTSAKNKVHALLTRYNVHLGQSDIFGREGIRQLRALEVPGPARWILDDLLADIEFFGEQIKGVERRLYGQLEPDKRVGLLMSMPGVGKLTAHFLLSEIGTIERFLSPSKLVSYCGLCPSSRRSASIVRYGSTKGNGRVLLKWALVESAHTAVRRDSYFARTFHRVARKRGKGKAYVAVARKMALVLWQMLREERTYIGKVRKTQVGSCHPMRVRA